jgi:hypothetical protein
MNDYKEQHRQACPALDKNDMETCYGRAYFTGKPGKSKKCDMKCKYMRKFKGEKKQ